MRTELPTARFARNRPPAAQAANCAAGCGIFCAAAWKEIGRAFHLSPRELQIVRGLFDGQKESAIAANIGCSPDTVHTHVKRVYAKMGVHGQVELLVRVMGAFLALPACPAGQPRAICRNRVAGHCPQG